MQIDHNPNEKRNRIPGGGEGEKEALRKRLGREPKPSDFLSIYGTAIALAVGFALYRYGWPF